MIKKLKLADIKVRSFVTGKEKGGVIISQALSCMGGFTCEYKTNCEGIWTEWYGNVNLCLPPEV